MITSVTVLEQPIIDQLMICDPVVLEYRAFFRPNRLEPGDRARWVSTLAWFIAASRTSVCKGTTDQKMRKI